MTWLNDLALGVRLAVGGGRTSKTGITRLLLSTVGIGLAVLVLLIAASVEPARAARQHRSTDTQEITTDQPGVAPLLIWPRGTDFHGVGIERVYVRATGPDSPLPPGIDRLPGPGESMLSPALADLLAAPGSELLRPRFPERVVGTVGMAGLYEPTTLTAFIGAPPSYEHGMRVFGYGQERPELPLPPELFIVLTLGVVTLLAPVFIFIATSARIAGAERDRRLAALRLVGSDARQVRRIAAAESLVSAAFGLVLGGGLFLLLRSQAADIEIAGESFFPSDLTPSWPLVLLIAVVVPLLAVLTTQFALRRAVIEPLGVVRHAKPVRRRILWRLLVIAAGVALLLMVDPDHSDSDKSTIMMFTGAALLLIGVPTLLPALLERVVTRLKGIGAPSFQLAIRRLQLDSGTPARVVSGVGIVLAGAVALQLVLLGQVTRYSIPVNRNGSSPALLQADNETGNAAFAALRKVAPHVDFHYRVRSFLAEGGGRDGLITVAECAQVRKILAVDRCTDGDAFVNTSGAEPPEAVLSGRVNAIEIDVDHQKRVLATVDLPTRPERVQLRPGSYTNVGQLILTPGVLAATPGIPMAMTAMFTPDPGDPDMVEHLRNVVDPFGDRARLNALSAIDYAQDAKMYLDLRRGLLIGAVFTLSVAAMSLLVVALEQMRERRRAIAALSATGVPTATLARSLLWQNAIPMILAVATSVATGIGLAALTFRLIRLRFTMDWTDIAILSGIAALLIILITALTLPTLRGATRLTALRTE